MVSVSRSLFSSPEQLGFITDHASKRNDGLLGPEWSQSFYGASVGDSVYECGCAETLMMMHEALGLVDEVIMHTFIDRKKGRAQTQVSFWVVCKKFLIANAVILCWRKVSVRGQIKSESRLD